MKKTEQKKKIISTFLNKIMNVTSEEWPRISISWFLQFFYKIGYIMGWTVLIAMFVTRYGIAALPYFFIIYALFRIISAFVYANFINRFRKDFVIIFSALAGCIVLFTGMLFSAFNMGVFIVTSIGVLAVFYSQIYILNSAFIEDLFSPLEGQRTFPVIESSETIGGIIGGLMVASFPYAIQPALLTYFLMGALLMIVPIMLSHRRVLKKLPFIRFKKKKILGKFNMQEFKNSVANMKQFPFLKVLVFVMFTQWIFHNLLEFQYTSAVYAGLGEGANAEHELTHGLGRLQILFHSFALLMQLLVASRIISYLGIISSLILHPIVTMLSLGTLLFKFGFASAVLTKMNFEMTNIIFTSAYHNSYYAMGHKVRESIREFLEGFIQPAGALCGMVLLLILEKFFAGSMLTSSITILMLAIMIFMLAVLLKNENKYTHVAVKNLGQSNDTILQLNAVEVLGQKGHRGSTEILIKTLKNSSIDDKVKVRILETLGHMREHDSILEILECLKSDNSRLKIAALKAIEKFDQLERNTAKFPFSRYRLNEVLKDIFSKEDDREIKMLIITIITKLNKNDIAPFIFDLLKTRDNRLIADCISVCRYFNDINLVHYLKPHLQSDDPRIKANTIHALWQFRHYRILLLPVFEEMINSTDLKEKIAAYRLAGDIQAVHQRTRLKEALKSADSRERLEAAGALCKMKYNEGIKILVDSILSSDIDIKERSLKIKESIPEPVSSYAHNLLLKLVSGYINRILSDSNKTSLEELDTDTLIKLRNAYELVNDDEEVHNIDEIINKNNQIIQSLQFNPS